MAFKDQSFESMAIAAKDRVFSTWAALTKRMKISLIAVVFLFMSLIITSPSMPETPDIPKITLDYSHGEPVSPFNASKVGLLVENRPNPILAPLMLHFMSVVPPDWRFRFMGSEESVIKINESVAIQKAVAMGKLDLTYIPKNMSTAGQEMISRFLTNLWLYETVLQPAEWLLVFQTDSILCANSKQSLNDYLDYDWVGAPWDPNGRYGGNGGLSLRRVSAIIDVLRNQVREDDSEPEDVWLTERLGNRVGAKVANGTYSLTFSGEMNAGKTEKVGGKKGSEHWVEGIDDWRHGFYEPMGYHTGGSGVMLHAGIWGKPELRQHIWNYCPEVKMTLAMDAAKYVPGNCGSYWKREAEAAAEALGDDEYPMLPAGLVPW